MPLLPKIHLSAGALPHTADTVLPSREQFGRTAARLLAYRPGLHLHPRLAGILVLVLIAAVLVTGGTQVANQLVARPKKAMIAQASARSWGNDIVGSLPPANRLDWEQLLEKNPTLVLDICSISLSPSQ